MISTQLDFLDDAQLVESFARIVGIEREGNQTAVILDRTIFFPKGGGQPPDTGVVSAGSRSFEVDAVYSDAGVVRHVGRMTGPDLEAGEEVTLRLNKHKRRLHMRLHSAGELLCAAMWDLGYSYPSWPVTRAIHYPERSSVEFGSALPLERREDVRHRLESKLNELIQEGGAVRVQAVGSPREASGLCGYFPDYLPQDQAVRVVTVWGRYGRPCQGTHVSDVGEIGEVRIRKVKVKKGKTTFSYSLVDKDGS